MKSRSCTFGVAPTILFIFLAASAQAAGLAAKVQETYRKTDSFRADFVQKTTVEVLGRDVEEGGDLVFSKPGRFSIHYQGKNERQYLSDGHTLWIYHPKDKEVEVIEDVQEIVSQEALAFLGGLAQMDREFKIVEGKDDQLTLVPKDKSEPFSKLLLTIDPASYLVREVDLFPKSGNKSHYVFTGVKVNEPVSDSLFVFKKSGVKEIKPLASGQ